MALPALHQGLPALRRRRSTTTSAACSTTSTERAGRRHGRHLHLGPGLLPRRPRLVRQALHVRGVAAHAVPRALPAGGARRARLSTSIVAQRRLRADVPRPRRRRACPATMQGRCCAAAARRAAARLAPSRCTTATGCTTTASTASGRHYGVRTEHAQADPLLQRPLDQPGARAGQAPEWELFDLMADPSELHNVFADPAYADVANALRAGLAPPAGRRRRRAPCRRRRSAHRAARHTLRAPQATLRR